MELGLNSIPIRIPQLDPLGTRMPGRFVPALLAGADSLSRAGASAGVDFHSGSGIGLVFSELLLTQTG